MFLCFFDNKINAPYLGLIHLGLPSELGVEIVTKLLKKLGPTLYGFCGPGNIR